MVIFSIVRQYIRLAKLFLYVTIGTLVDIITIFVIIVVAIYQI